MNNISKRAVVFLLAVVFSVCTLTGSVWAAPAPASDATTEASKESTTNAEEEAKKEEVKKTLEEQQQELQESITESEKKLKELAKDSKVTQEYIDTLDQKIGSMNDQLTVMQEQIDENQKEIDKLKPQIKKNEEQLKALEEVISESQEELDGLNEKFEATYEAYCYRLRVMYISGHYSIITALLSCKDVSGFLTRYEMIKAVAKSDTELLQEVNTKMEEICTKQDGLNEQKKEYETIKADLDKKNDTLKTKQDQIERNQETIAANKITLASDRAESDALLAKLNSQNQMYTEFRNEDEELTKAVQDEISALISGLKSPDEVTTLSDEDKKHTTSASNGGSYSAEGIYNNSDAVLNMKYPMPGNYTISAGFPNYSSGKYHGGIDFPCSTGSKVVAAQSGVVIKVKRLDYSYGYYVMIYHGTDSRGRTVVTLYAHNSSILVGTGETVKKGQQIAKSGSTGNSTGPHCHFEIRLDGSRVNPTYYLSK